MPLDEIIVKVVDKHPYLSIIYFFVFGTGLVFGIFWTGKFSIKIFELLTKNSNGKAKGEDETKKKLEEIYFLIKEAEKRGIATSETLRRIEIDLKIILEKLRGKGL